MAISRRLRYEILRRDNHTCRYCGGSAPDVKLTVDHVVPLALGGGDDPTNLATACQACNAGKSSSAPDAPLVDDVRQDALRWGRAIELAAETRRAKRSERGDYVRKFDHAWRHSDLFVEKLFDYWRTLAERSEPLRLDLSGLFVVAKEPPISAARDEAVEVAAGITELMDLRVPLIVEVIAANSYRSRFRQRTYSAPRPEGWEASVWRFYEAGLPIEDLIDCIKIAQRNDRLSADSQFKYMAGCAWRMVTEMQQTAEEILAAGETI